MGVMAVRTAKKIRISIQPATVTALEALRAHERHEEVRQDRHRHDQPDELDRAHTRSSPSSRRKSTAKASAPNPREERSWSESRMEAKVMPPCWIRMRQGAMPMHLLRIKMS